MTEYNYKPTFTEPITYQYSKYEGARFLRAYKNYRKEKVSDKQANISWPSDLSESELIDKIKVEEKTEEKLKLLLSLQEKDCKDEFIYETLSIFTKKYEVFKKLYDQYDENYKKIGSTSNNLVVYMYFSANLILYLKKELNFKFLNVLLKVNDLICSEESEQSDLFNFIIHSEIELIEQCIKQKGVAIE